VSEGDEDTAKVELPPSQLPVAGTLFVLTCLSVFWVGSLHANVEPTAGLRMFVHGAAFAVPFLAILVFHELGHYVVARLHGVSASLPYFLPLPLWPLGTLGAVIGMRDEVKRRDALLDIGAAGPLCGLVIALPVLAYGLHTAPIEALDPRVSYQMEGRSIIYWALLYAIKGPIPAGHDIVLTPTAFAGWAGLLVTMMNLAPIGQLDGGHVAYALFGKRQDRFSERVRIALIAFGGAMVGYGAFEARHAPEVLPSMIASGSWLMWGLLLTAMERMMGTQHPTTEGEPLDPRRRAVAWFCLLLFVLLFMPRWMVPGI
jgi:membrane-associated protease RseP (regulator of RpoE activity)